MSLVHSESRGFAALITLTANVALVGYLGLVLIDWGWFGAGRLGTRPVPAGPVAVAMSRSPRSSALVPQPTARGQALLADWAGTPLHDWETSSKVTAPRILLAKLALGEDVDLVNRNLLEAYVPRASGSTWLLQKGDYDFTEITLTGLLYLYGEQPDRLHPEVRDHIVDRLLIEKGSTPRIAVPKTLGLVTDTENHHLMTEVTRYLRNQWLFDHGHAEAQYDNAANGLEAWLLGYLQEMVREGVYEFNSIPYLGFTIQALLTIEAFARSDDLSMTARYLLDTMNLQYALGSLDLRRCAPFRRRVERAGWTRLDQDPHTDAMRVWVSEPYVEGQALPAAEGHNRFGLVAELLPYRLAPDVRAWVLAKPHEYFVRFGRGSAASPEIYSGGPGYLLSAGGVNRGIRSMIAARPTSLMLSDGAIDLRECFHIMGRGLYTRWNNTGVYRRFACGNGPVAIPKQYTPEAEDDVWKVFSPGAVPRLRVATFSDEAFGLIALFPESSESPQELLDRIAKANPSPSAVKTRFVWPDGSTVTYNVNVPRGRWVIASVDGRPQPRDYDKWPQFDGDPLGIDFDRAGVR
ncbi:MAG TPA: hypothetical protein PK468_23600 [Candidatus Hydrogenedentes bacterium]|nr:hypothetical protein [Candidatus Hydrogenedentota bacterium]